MTDPEIATALLDLDDSTPSTHLEKRAAAMITLTVYLAEEWRKQGAGKIYRAILRLIKSGDRTFDDFLNDFKFIGSADDGQRQVGRFYDVWLGATKREDLDDDEGAIYDVLSPQHTPTTARTRTCAPTTRRTSRRSGCSRRSTAPSRSDRRRADPSIMNLVA